MIVPDSEIQNSEGWEINSRKSILRKDQRSILTRVLQAGNLSWCPNPKSLEEATKLITLLNINIELQAVFLGIELQ